MKVLKNYHDIKPHDAQRGVALGNFDGIHLGHQALLHRLTKECGRLQLEPTVYTFLNHPGMILENHQKLIYPARITPIPLKIKIMEKLGVKLLFLDTFTTELMIMDPQEFVEQILVDSMKAKLLVVGDDFRFGKAAGGDIHLLRKLSTQYGYELIVVEPVFCGNRKISSSQIRKHIEKGEMEAVTSLLGRPFMMLNQVERGYGRGKQLGYPTANLILEEQQMVPADGVYATLVHIDGKVYMGATSIGSNPTFGTQSKTIETYIIDFDHMLYEKEIELYFYKKIRDQITFDNPESLKSKIRQDVQEIKAYLQTQKTMIV